MTFCHFAYGLRIRANVAIPGLTAIDDCDPADVEINSGSLPGWLDTSAEASAESYRKFPVGDGTSDSANRVFLVRDGSYFWFRYADDTQFVVSSAGDHVWFTWREPFTLEDATTYLLGPIFGFLLRLRGYAGLHASAVAESRGAIAIVGPAGAGKSTTAGWFVQHGFRLIADDHVILDPSADSISVIPSYPRLRLWPTSVDMLYDRPDALPLLTPNWEKRYLQIEHDLANSAGSSPLVAIFFLAERADEERPERVMPLTPSEAFIRLSANSHVSRLLTSEMRADDFRVMSRVAKEIPCSIVYPSSNPADLPSLCREILAYTAGIEMAGRG